MENNYEYIANPITGERFQTNSLEGRAILKNLIRSSLYGGSSVQMGGGVDEFLIKLSSKYTNKVFPEGSKKSLYNLFNEQASKKTKTPIDYLKDIANRLNEKYIGRVQEENKQWQSIFRNDYHTQLKQSLENLNMVLSENGLNINLTFDSDGTDFNIIKSDDDNTYFLAEETSSQLQKSEDPKTEQQTGPVETKTEDPAAQTNLKEALGAAIKQLQKCIVELITNGKNTDFVKNFDINVQLPEGHKELERGITEMIASAKEPKGKTEEDGSNPGKPAETVKSEGTGGKSEAKVEGESASSMSQEEAQPDETMLGKDEKFMRVTVTDKEKGQVIYIKANGTFYTAKVPNDLQGNSFRIKVPKEDGGMGNLTLSEGFSPQFVAKDIEDDDDSTDNITKAQPLSQDQVRSGKPELDS